MYCPSVYTIAAVDVSPFENPKAPWLEVLLLNCSHVAIIKDRQIHKLIFHMLTGYELTDL